MDDRSFWQITSIEKDRVSHVAQMITDIYGFGKKTLGDTNIIWITPTEARQNAISQNSQYVALKNRGESIVKVFSSLTQQLIYELPLNTSELEIAAISNDGKWLAAKPDWRGIQVYDLTTKHLIYSDEQSIGPVLFSKDISQMILRMEHKFVAYDLKSRKIIRDIPLNVQAAYPGLVFGNGRFGIANYENAPYQLWNLKLGKVLGDFYFFDLPDHAPAWIFMDVDGNYDGSPAGLSMLYQLDELNFISKDFDYKNDPKYRPGLLNKFF
jgi:hypothetical protein